LNFMYQMQLSDTKNLIKMGYELNLE